MAYEAFNNARKPRFPRKDPAISLDKMGRIIMNRSAAEIFFSTNTTHVLLLWDNDARRFAIRKANKDDERAYLVHFGDWASPRNGKKKTGSSCGASVSCKAFLDHIGAVHRENPKYAAHWNEEHSLLEVEVTSCGIS